MQQIGKHRKSGEGSSSTRFESCVKTLKELAPDVLAGDHTVFKELAAYGEWQMSQYLRQYLNE